MVIQNVLFTVDKEPYCVWGTDLQQSNTRFIKSIDSEYFGHIAAAHADYMEGDDKQRSATALRASWYHGLETMFALICAALQVPEYVPGWMGMYKTGSLRQMIQAVSKGNPDFIVKCPIHPVSWESIAAEIVRASYPDQNRTQQTKLLFAKLWRRFASDFTDEKNVKEYNSIKHGARTSAGGFSLAIATEKDYAVPPPSNQMHVLGASEFGSSFTVLKPIGKAKRNPNLGISISAVNWSPEAVIYSLQLISWSVNNIKSYLLLKCGVLDAPFVRPEDDSIFDKPWGSLPTISNLSLSEHIDGETIPMFTEGEILAKLMERFPTGGNSST